MSSGQKRHARTFDARPTPRQAQVLDAVLGFTRRLGLPPTMREIMSMTGGRSVNGIRDHLRLIQRKGLIERLPMRARGIRVTAAGKRAVTNWRRRAR